MIGLDQTAAIYTPGTDGDYTVLSKASLPCRLILARSATSPADERADPASGAFVLWGPDYTMPGDAQLAIGGKRYNVQANTVAALRGLSSVIYQRATVEAAL
jgi:hypothetical protein